MTFHPPQPLLPSHLSPHHSPHLAYSPAQIPIARRNDVALVLLHALTQAVVCICALVHAGDALTAGVLQGEGGSEQETVLQAGKALSAM